MSDHQYDLISALKDRIQRLEMELARERIVWLPITDDEPVPGERYLVSVATDDGDEVHILYRKRSGAGWIHDGEYTFHHGYFFRPVMWARVPEVPERNEEEY